MLPNQLMNFIENIYNMTNYITKKFADEDSPKVGSVWDKKTNEERKESIEQILVKNNHHDTFQVIKADNNGQVILRTEKTIKASKRGVMLLELEYLIKESVDNGITLWLEPVGDKSKLRNLRGIKIKNEN